MDIIGEIHIVPYEDKYKDGVVDILQYLWGKSYEYRAERFIWQYYNNPYHNEILALVAVDDSNRVLGFRGWVPATISKDKILLVRAADAVVHKDARRRGIFERLTKDSLEYLKLKGCKAILNLSSNKFSNPGYVKLGWQKLAKFDIWYFINIYGKRNKNIANKQYKENDIIINNAIDTSNIFINDSIKHYFINLDNEIIKWLCNRTSSKFIFSYSKDKNNKITSLFIFSYFGKKSSLQYFSYTDFSIARYTFKETMKRIDSKFISVWAFALPKNKKQFLKKIFFIQIPFYRIIKSKPPILVKLIDGVSIESNCSERIDNIDNWEINQLDSF